MISFIDNNLLGLDVKSCIELKWHRFNSKFDAEIKKIQKKPENSKENVIYTIRLCRSAIAICGFNNDFVGIQTILNKFHAYSLLLQDAGNFNSLMDINILEIPKVSNEEVKKLKGIALSISNRIEEWREHKKEEHVNFIEKHFLQNTKILKEYNKKLDELIGARKNRFQARSKRKLAATYGVIRSFELSLENKNTMHISANLINNFKK